MKKILQCVLALALMAVVLVGYQIHTTSKALSAARESGLAAWAGSNATRQREVRAFRSACIENGATKVPVSIYECGEEYGSKELADVLKGVDDKVVPPAPLRWL